MVLLWKVGAAMMNKETKEALEKAIDKYTKHVELVNQHINKNTTIMAIGINIGPQSCSLCNLFYEHDCKGCPIYNKTGIILCQNSPYKEIEWLFCSKRPITQSTVEAFESELNFLISLREE